MRAHAIYADRCVILIKMLKKIKEWTKSKYFKYEIIIYITVTIIFFLSKDYDYTPVNSDQIKENGIRHIARIIDTHYSKSNNYCVYEIIYKGKIYNIKSWGCSSNKLGEYYNVKVDTTNPKNSRIYGGMINPFEELKQGSFTKGIITKSQFSFKPYIEVSVKYDYQNYEYITKTRVHIDSLDCVEPEYCVGKEIDLIFSKKHPKLNSLYFNSYGRKLKLLEKYY